MTFFSSGTRWVQFKNGVSGAVGRCFRLMGRPSRCIELTGRALVLTASEGPGALWRRLCEKLAGAPRTVPLPPRAGGFTPNVPVIHVPLDDPRMEAPPALDATVTVVIPTKNAGGEFDGVLSRLKRQRGVKEMDIVVVDSGSTDDTVATAGRQGARVHEIDPASFNHGRTRNIGLDLAAGDYVLFMTQDAMPIGDGMIAHMARVMASNADVAAVTCRQVPRSDADLFYTWSMANHYRVLEMTEDRISGTDDPDRLPPLRLRAIAGIDNVCTLYRRRVLQAYRFNPLPFAEDLDVGVRMVKDGHKLAFLASQGVVHSHNRPAFYCLKRSYLDTQCLGDIIGSQVESPYPGVGPLIHDAVNLYERINGFMAKEGKGCDARRLAASVDHAPRSEDPASGDTDLHAFMTRLKASVPVSGSTARPAFSAQFKGVLSSFQAHLDQTGAAVDDTLGEEVKDGVYKIFATILGNQLAAHASRGERLPVVDAALTVGV